MEIEIIGGYEWEKISNFAKIVEITKEEYDMK
jgi:hypothetical protein